MEEQARLMNKSRQSSADTVERRKKEGMSLFWMETKVTTIDVLSLFDEC